MILLLGVGAILSVASLAYVSIVELEKFNQTINETLDKEVRKIAYARKVKVGLLELQRNERDTLFVAKLEKNDINNYLKLREEIEKELQKDLYTLDGLVEKQRTEMAMMRNVYEEYKELFLQIQQMLQQSDMLDNAQKLSLTRAKGAIDKAFVLADKIIKLNEDELKIVKRETDAESYEYAQFVKQFSVLLFGLILILAATLYTLFIKRIEVISALVAYIKKGDFALPYAAKITKANDELGVVITALHDTTHLLEKSYQFQKHQNWLKNSFLELSSMLQEKQKLLEITQTALKEICQKTGAAMGVLYIYNPKSEVLDMYACYAYKGNLQTSQSYRLGEGIVGQVGLDKEAILLKDIREINTPITTGTTQSLPLNTYTFPLLFKGELQGVVEVASFALIDTKELEYFDGLVQTLGSFIYSAISAQETMQLLETTQKQAQELEVSQQKLEEQTRELEYSQKELEIHNSELSTAKFEIEKRSGELEEASKYKSEFIANMSHELRTPLNSINILSRVLADNSEGNLTFKQQEQALTIYNSGKDLLQLINDILDLSKIEAKMMSLHLDTMEVDSLAQELFSMFEPLAVQKGVKLHLEIGIFEDKNIYSDKEKIRQIMKNFLSNALKFTDKEGEIFIKAHAHEDTDPYSVELTIKDTGIGIPQNKLDTIFEEFRQVDGSTSRKYGGTGLGLSISKKLADLLGAVIKVTSEETKGSSFTLLLPKEIETKHLDTDFVDIVKMSAKNSLLDEILIPSGVLDDRENLSIYDKKILIIEDDIRFASIVQEEAKKYGLKTIIATNGKAGLELALTLQPIGIILDMNLPIMDGKEVLSMLKADTHTRHIPVKIISIDKPDIASKKLGAVDFIQKPLEPKALENIIESMIQKHDKVKKELLIVNADDDTTKNLMQTLESDDVEIICVASAQEAIEIVKNRHLDCAVIDIDLPDMSGFKLLDIVKKHSCNLPVVVYSSRELHPEELKKLYGYGENAVIKTVQSDAQLLEETSLFLHRLYKNFSPAQKKLFKSALKSDTIFAEKKVLLVDDDARNIFALDGIMSEQGMKSFIAYNGQEALAELEKNNDIDIILMDIMMPIMDGYEAIKEVRKNPLYDKIPIIALTAKAQKEDRQKCLDAGADDYMSKPIDYMQLLQLMKVWMKNK